MEAFLTYLLKSAICLAALYIVYWLFLRKDTFFKANRVFLITSIILSFIIPLFQFDFVYNETEVDSKLVDEFIKAFKKRKVAKKISKRQEIILLHF